VGKESRSKKGYNTAFAEAKANFLASTQADSQGGSQLLDMVLVLDIYFGLSGMIILVSLPATGFFMCKSPLSLPLEDNQVTSQAVDPGWQNLAGHERSGKGTRLLAPRMQWQGCLWVRSCRHMPTSPVLGVCEQLVVWRQARGAGWL